MQPVAIHNSTIIATAGSLLMFPDSPVLVMRGQIPRRPAVIIAIGLGISNHFPFPRAEGRRRRCPESCCPVRQPSVTSPSQEESPASIPWGKVGLQFRLPTCGEQAGLRRLPDGHRDSLGSIRFPQPVLADGPRLALIPLDAPGSHPSRTRNRTYSESELFLSRAAGRDLTPLRPCGSEGIITAGKRPP